MSYTIKITYNSVSQTVSQAIDLFIQLVLFYNQKQEN